VIRCGVCGGGFSKISERISAAQRTRNKATCENRLTSVATCGDHPCSTRDPHRMMDPELYSVFRSRVTANTPGLQDAIAGGLAAKRSELALVRRRLAP